MYRKLRNRWRESAVEGKGDEDKKKEKEKEKEKERARERKSGKGNDFHKNLTLSTLYDTAKPTRSMHET